MSAGRGGWWLRRFGLVLCVVAVLSVSFAVPIGAEESNQAETSVQAWTGSSGFDEYSDVRNKYYDDVNTLRGLGAFEGTDCAKNKFCSLDPIDRKTFAVWLVRILDGDNAPDLAASNSQAAPRFEDVPRSSPYNGFVERLAELGITTGCSIKPSKYCPDSTIHRAQLATFMVRALDLPDAEPIGFWDVDEGDRHFDSINSFVKAELDSGCSEIRFVPFDYCPNQLVTRGEMAELLVKTGDYLKAREIIKIDPNLAPDNSINLRVDFEDSTHTTKVSWQNPAGKPSGVDYYVLQLRPSWGDFNYSRYRVVEPNSQDGGYEVKFGHKYGSTPEDIYALYVFRVITVYTDGSRSVTGEVKTPSQNRQLRDLTETRVIDAYGDSQPWLVDAWRHVNGPDSGNFAVGRRNAVGRSSVGGGDTSS